MLRRDWFAVGFLVILVIPVVQSAFIFPFRKRVLGLHYYEQPTISDDVNARTESIGMEWMIKLLQAAASAGKNVALVIQSSINKNNELPDTYLLDAGDHDTLDQ